MKLFKQLLSFQEGEGSRKVQVLFLGTALLVFGDKLGFSAEQLDQAKWVILSYLGAQGAADVATAFKSEPAAE